MRDNESKYGMPSDRGVQCIDALLDAYESLLVYKQLVDRDSVLVYGRV